MDNDIPTPGTEGMTEKRRYSHAPKITKSDQRVSFLRHSAAEAALRARVCGGSGGSLWTNVYPPVSQPKKGSKDQQLELPLSYPHPLEESSAKKGGSPKRIILEEISELLLFPSDGDSGGLDQQNKKYQAYRRVIQSMNFGNSSSNEQLGLDAVFVPNQSYRESPPDPLFWLLRFGEDEYVDVETTGANGEKVTERKPRVSWGLCTRLGLDDKKEEDKGAVTFVIPEDGGKFGLLRVGKIKVEGKGARPARQVMKELAVKAG